MTILMTREGLQGLWFGWGAIEFLTVCAIALERQVERLRSAKSPDVELEGVPFCAPLSPNPSDEARVRR